MTSWSRKIRRVALKPKVSKQNPSFAFSSKFHNQCPQLSLQMVKPLLTLVRYLELIHEFRASKIRLRYLITIWGAPKSIKMLGKRKKGRTSKSLLKSFSVSSRAWAVETNGNNRPPQQSGWGLPSFLGEKIPTPCGLGFQTFGTGSSIRVCWKPLKIAREIAMIALEIAKVPWV